MFTLSHYKNILIICLIIFLFLSPLWLANWFYYKGNYLITHTINYGTLITPPIDLKQVSFKDLQNKILNFTRFKNHWTLLTVTSSKNPNSLKKLYELRQIRLMLGKDMNKVERVLLFYDVKSPLALPSKFTSPYIGTLFIAINKEEWKHLFKFNQVNNLIVYNGFFIIDPEGRLMMAYDPSINPKSIMQDLRRLINT